MALGLLSPKGDNPDAGEAMQSLRRFAIGLTSLIFIMILSGGFVAGIRAGLAYNTLSTDGMGISFRPKSSSYWIHGIVISLITWQLHSLIIG